MISFPYIFVVSIAASTPGANIADHASLVMAFKQALLGDTDAIDARDKKVRSHLLAQGVKIEGADQNEAPIDITYIFKKPIFILGQPVYRVNYQGDSGSEFFAETQGNLANFIKIQKLRRVDRNKENEKYIYGDYFRWIIEPTKEMPYPNTFFVQVGNSSKGTFTFGTQTFDY
jgi:hypothetical protein